MATITNNLELGSVYGWGNISLIMFGSELVGFEGIEWKKSQKKEHIYGVGREPRGVGRGNNEYTGSIDILYDELIKIINNSPNGSITDLAPFSMYVYFSSTSTNPPSKVILSSVEFLENPFKTMQGETHIKMTLPILIGQITYA